MNKEHRMIWEFIDGTLQGAERKVFEQRLQQEEMLRREFERLLTFHESLKAVPPAKAPDALLEGVMAKYPQKAYVRNLSPSFSGVRTILLITGGLTAIFSLLVLLINGNPAESSGDIFSRFIGGFDSLLNFNPGAISFLPYTLVLLCAIFLVWLDNKLKWDVAHQR